MKSSGDELEELFRSSNPDDLFRFYRRFNSKEKLIEWMTGRPPAEMSIVERGEGDGLYSDAVVVIPTADANGQFAVSCSNSFFNGFKIIFVQSSGPFFNVSRSVDFGVRHALKYDPKWVVISADDVVKADDPSVLATGLSKADSGSFDTLFTRPYGFYHSFPGVFGRETRIGQLLRGYAQYRNTDGYRVLKKFHANSWLHIPDFASLLPETRERYTEGTENTFPTVLRSALGLYRHFLRQKMDLIELRSLGILSAPFVQEMGPSFADPTYVNSAGDIDLSIRIAKRNRFGFIDYKIRYRVGGSLGDGRDRKLRDIAGDIYLDHRLRKKLI